MPLLRKWRSMDLFGSHENLSGKQPGRSFRARLSSLSGGIKDEAKKEDPGGGESNQMVQRCVIIQRDEKGYGLTVSGDNPVFVQSVKAEGAAARAGVQQGDKIVKVNGNLVLNRNHLDVVKLIKSGSYVALTLLGKPPTTGSGPSPAPASNTSVRDSLGSRVTAPKPVDREKDRELWQQKVHTLRAMHEQACDDYKKLQQNYIKSPSERLHSQLLEKEKTVKTLENQLKALTGQDPTTPLLSDLDPSPSSMEPISSPSWASSFPNRISDSDSPHTSPSISPTPMHPNNSAVDEESMKSESRSEDVRPIISAEDDDFNSEEEPLDGKPFSARPVSPFMTRLQHAETNDHGPFRDITLLEKKPAHLAVFVHFLISNNDPSSVFFYIIADIFSRAPGSSKELRKWAYEIYSTFLVQNAPLRVDVEDVLLNQIDNVLTTSSSKVDSETTLRSVFDQARQAVKGEVQDLLGDFRNKSDLGLGSMYHAHELQDNMEKTSEMKIIEKCLVNHLEYCMNEKNSHTGRNQAMGWALATLLRSMGMTKSTQSNVLERAQSFVMKDKKSMRFLRGGGKNKTIRGHPFAEQHYYRATSCHYCGEIIWGVGNQGYQCQTCDINVHKTCMEEVQECGGKQKKVDKKRISSMIPIIPAGRKPSNPNQQAGPPPSAVQEALREAAAADGKGVTDLSITTQPIRRDDESDLAGLPTGHSVKSIVQRYEVVDRQQSPTEGEQELTAAVKKGSDLGRSESMKGRGEKGDRPARRAKSDVDMDEAAFKSLNQSGSSSASSLSNRGMDSPSNSYEIMTDVVIDEQDLDVETELPSLKEALGDEPIRKLKPKEKKRQEVINELFHTERCHMRNLIILYRLFFRPLFEGVNPNLSRLLFPNIEEMIRLHKTLNNEMKAKRKDHPLVGDVGELLLRRFDKEAGEEFQKGCAVYCEKQAVALDVLRKAQRKDYKLSQFLNDAESNPLCRRLQLKDLLPAQMQRLTKYPLLIENLLKYTQQNSEEHICLLKAHRCSKSILEHVNQTIREHENTVKLEDFQKRMDKRQVENMNDKNLEEIKKLDLKEHRLVYDGELSWRLRSHRMVELHVVLLEDIIVLLQKQDEKLILKYHSANQSNQEKFTHSPVLRLQNLLARNVATDKKAFFVVNTSETGPQIYELIAKTPEERKRWCRFINDFSDKNKNHQKSMPRQEPEPSNSSIPFHHQEPEEITLVRDTLKRPSRGTSSSSLATQEAVSSQPQEAVYASRHDFETGVELGEHAMYHIDDNLIQPEEVNISDAVIVQAEPVLTTMEKLRRLDEKIHTNQQERAQLLTDLAPEEFLKYQLRELMDNSSTASAENLVQDILEKSCKLLRVIQDSEHSLSNPRELADSGAARGEDQKGAPVPMNQLKDMAAEMHQIINNLLHVVGNNREERDRLRNELIIAQEKISRLKEIQRSMTADSPPTPGMSTSRPTSFVTVASSISEAEEGDTTPGETASSQDGDVEHSMKMENQGVAHGSDEDESVSNRLTGEVNEVKEELLEQAEKLEEVFPVQQGAEEVLDDEGGPEWNSTAMGTGQGSIPPSDNSDSDSDTCKAVSQSFGPGGGAFQTGLSLNEVDQLESFMSQDSDATLVSSSMMTTDLDDGAIPTTIEETVSPNTDLGALQGPDLEQAGETDTDANLDTIPYPGEGDGVSREHEVQTGESDSQMKDSLNPKRTSEVSENEYYNPDHTEPVEI